MSKIMVDETLCKGCKLCIVICPKKIIALSDTFNSQGERFAVQIDESKCIGCKFCGMMCPDSAISVYK